jgi:hypothetical protein
MMSAEFQNFTAERADAEQSKSAWSDDRSAELPEKYRRKPRRIAAGYG